jgi:predicted Zn-dependent peptidase
MFKKTILRNGLRIITVPQKGTKTVTVLVLAATGSKYEDKKINGISHLLEHLLFKGTVKRPDKIAISEPLDRIGGYYNAFTGEEYTGYFAKVGSTNFDLALDIISDIYLNSKLDPKEIKKEKGVVIEEMNMYFDNPISYVQNLWNKVLYGDQPAGRDIIGTKESVLSFSRKQLFDYMKTQYSSLNTIVCVAGNIPSSEQVIDKIKKHFSGIETKKIIEKYPVIEEQKEPRLILKEKKTDQTHFCLGVRAYDSFHPKKYVQEVLALALGGMMSSRLFVKIREELGLAYYVKTSVSSYPENGYLVTQAGVDNTKVEKAISAVLKEYKKISQRQIPQEELNKVKEYFRGKLSLKLETSEAQAFFYGGQEVTEKKILSPKEICAEIDKVSSTDVLDAAQDIFRPEKLNLALIGPFKDKDKLKRALKF